MILIVTPNLGTDQCTALGLAVGEEVVVAHSLRQAATFLRADSYLVVVLDQYLLESEPEETETVMRHLGTAIPLQVNLALSGVKRFSSEVRAALKRRKREEVAARNAAVSTLRCELNGTVTALLLSCELALSAPDMPSSALEKLQSTHELVRNLRSQLESSLVEA
jgi:N-dimethylarginine dimethylaminohydrolase